MAHPEVLISRATLEQRGLVQRMLELYQHDLSDIWDQDLDEHGVFGYELDRYWNSVECTPYLFRVAHQAAGFALVDRQVKLPGGDHWLDQFFVMKKYRRRGVGAAAAVQVFAAHPGHWQVGEMPGNIAAQRFWRRVIGQYTGGQFTEHSIASGWWQGPVQSFTVVHRTDRPQRQKEKRSVREVP